MYEYIKNIRRRDTLNIDFTVRNGIVNRLQNQVARMIFPWNHVQKILPIYVLDWNYAIAFSISSNISYIVSGQVPSSNNGEYHNFMVPLKQVVALMKYDTRNNQEMVKNFIEAHTIQSPFDSLTTQYIVAYIMHTIINDKKKTGLLRDLLNPFLYKLEEFPIDINFKKIEDVGRIGLKKIMISHKDAVNLTSVGSAFFREIQINRLINLLVANCICTSFPLMVNWTISKGSNEFCFNNGIAVAKYRNNKKYRKSNRLLYASKTEISDIETNDLRTNIPINGIVGTHNNYINGINSIIYYSEKEMIYSDSCGILLSEHVGDTLYNFLSNEEGPTVFNDISKCESLIFQILFGVQALVSRIGAVHGDLHIGNVTIKKTRFNMIRIINNKQYWLENANEIFILDFGRAIFSPKFIELSEIQIESQNMIVKSNLERMLSDFYYDNQVFFAKFLKMRPNELYALCSGLDVLMFIESFRKIFARKFEHEIVFFLNRLETFMQNVIIDTIHDWKSSENFKLVYPAALAIEQFFSTKDSMEYEECHSYCDIDNEFIYDFMDSKKQLPFGSTENYVENFENFKLTLASIEEKARKKEDIIYSY